jgi:CheY-like chemotaxis protein
MAHKILIADDDRDFLTTLSVRLEAEGYQVFCVQDSYQAVAQALKAKPDVLILDINMPAGDGFTVQDRIKKIDHLKEIPVIYLTGERSDRVKSLAKARQAFALVFKPFETDDLLSAVSAAAAAPRPVSSV